MIFALPLFNAITSAISITEKNRKVFDCIAVITAAITSLLTLHVVYMLVKQQVQINISLPYVFHGIKYSFKTSKYGLMFLTLVSVMYPISLIYSISYFRKKTEDSKKFMSFFHLSIFCCFAIAVSNNLVTSFIFYELITLCTYPLVIQPISNHSRSVGKKYLVYLVGLSVLLTLPSLIILREVAGTLSFSKGGILSSISLSQFSVNLLFFAILFGTAKTAIFPVGGWLVNAMSAPVPISAIIHAVVVVKSGLFLIFQVITGIFGVNFLSSQIYRINGLNLFSIISLITIFVATIRAISADNLKARLAYSTIAQSCYTLLMFSVLSQNSIRAGMMQLAAHSIAKITLFFSIGALFIVKGSYSIRNVNSQWRKSPIVSFAVTLSCLSILGLPPTIGFQAKYNMVLSLIEKRDFQLIIYIILSTFLSSYYIFDILYNFLFMPKGTDRANKLIKLPNGMLFSMVFLCCLIIVGTFFMDKIIYAIL